MNAACIVSMKMNWDTDFLLERFHQQRRRIGLTQSGHILNGQDMCSHFLQLFGQINVVLQIVLGAFGIENVAGVADRCFANGAGFQYRVHRHLHVGRPIQRIEYAKHIQTSVGGFFNKRLHHIIRIVCVSDRIGGPQQHLQQNVWHFFADVGQALPRILFQKSH